MRQFFYYFGLFIYNNVFITYKLNKLFTGSQFKLTVGNAVEEKLMVNKKHL